MTVFTKYCTAAPVPRPADESKRAVLTPGRLTDRMPILKSWQVQVLVDRTHSLNRTCNIGLKDTMHAAIHLVVRLLFSSLATHIPALVAPWLDILLIAGKTTRLCRSPQIDVYSVLPHLPTAPLA